MRGKSIESMTGERVPLFHSFFQRNTKAAKIQAISPSGTAVMDIVQEKPARVTARDGSPTGKTVTEKVGRIFVNVEESRFA